MENTNINYKNIKVVQTREELIYLLSRASELEHGLACVYHGKIVHETQYFADPFEAPAWRSQLVKQSL